MKKFHSRWRDFGYFVYRWIFPPAVDIRTYFKVLPRYIGFIQDWWSYRRLPGAESIRIQDSCPCVYEQTATTGFDHHYFYQNIWAFKKIYKTHVERHVDVGSSLSLVGYLSTICHVTFIDIRPPLIELDHLEARKGNILNLPFKDHSVQSLSTLHVAEHIGLGRYGDQLDPQGTEKACRELSRVLAPEGNLYFSLPVGRSRLCFNAHRVHSPQMIIDYFDGLTLIEFSGIDDSGRFIKNIDPKTFEDADYACGLFHFTKKGMYVESVEK